MISRRGSGVLADGEASKPKNADLPARFASALVMVAVAGAALWLGGLWWGAFVLLVAAGTFWEWQTIVRRFPGITSLGVVVWCIAGALYIAFAANTLAVTRDFVEQGMADAGLFYVSMIVGTVIGVDVGAYFMGRTLGGPKIAPKISPSKTWAGLLGGAIGATIVITLGYTAYGMHWSSALETGWIAGVLAAVIAQAGDFFESWMKRRAGMKDSSNLIPGHGGLFDRVDGLLAVCFAVGLAHAFVRYVL